MIGSWLAQTRRGSFYFEVKNLLLHFAFAQLLCVLDMDVGNREDCCCSLLSCPGCQCTVFQGGGFAPQVPQKLWNNIFQKSIAFWVPSWWCTYNGMLTQPVSWLAQRGEVRWVLMVQLIVWYKRQPNKNSMYALLLTMANWDMAWTL